MTRLFMDGAELGDLLAWDVTDGAPTASTAHKRSGAYSYQVDSGESVSKAVNNLAEMYVRFALYFTTLGTNRLLAFKYNTTYLGTIRLNGSTGRIDVYRGDTTALLGSSSVSLLPNTWYVIEAHWVLNDSTGVFDLKIDNNLEIEFTGDTKPGSDTYANSVTLGASGDTFWYDDIAINDTNGSTHNSWCGDGHIEYLPDNGNGDTSEWTGSDGNQVDNYQMTDEVPPDSDTTYITDSTSGHVDMAEVTAWDGTYKLPTFVWTEARARGILGGEQIKIGLKTNGAVYAGSAQSLLASYRRHVGDLHEVNPQTLEAWTEGEINAAQSRVETV